MARFVSGVRGGATPTTARPWMSVYSASATGFTFRECGIFNAGAVATPVKMTRLTAQGTPGSALTAAEYDPGRAATATSFGSHTADATLGDDLGMRDTIGAAIGSGVRFSAVARGIQVASGTGNGVGVILATGSSTSPVDTYIIWDE